MIYLIYSLIGLGGGVLTGLAGLTAAMVVTPILVGGCGWNSYDATTIALIANVPSSIITAYTYYKNGNIKIKEGIKVATCSFIGTVLGSYLGYLFSQNSEGGIGTMVMIGNIFLGLKFIVKPLNSSPKEASEQNQKKTLLALFLGFLIGVECGFMGSAGGIMMLSVFVLLLNYDLRFAVGTSSMVMTLVALAGSISHVMMGAEIPLIPGVLITVMCFIGASISAKIANKIDSVVLNRIVGIILVALGVIPLLFNI